MLCTHLKQAGMARSQANQVVPTIHCRAQDHLVLWHSVCKHNNIIIITNAAFYTHVCCFKRLQGPRQYLGAHVWDVRTHKDSYSFLGRG